MITKLGIVNDVLDAAKLDQAQALFDANPGVRIDLERSFGSSDLRSILLKNILLDERGLRRLVVSAGRPELITDQNLRLEYDTPLALFGDEVNSRQMVISSIMNQLDVSLHSKLALDWNSGAGQMVAIKSLKTELFQAGLTRQAHALVELARIWEPQDPELMVDDLVFSQTIEPVDFQDSVRRLVSEHPLEAYRLGKLLSQGARHAQALSVFEPLTQAQPNSATAWTSLGIVYAAIGREADSKAAQARAYALDPINELTRGVQQVSDETPR